MPPPPKRSQAVLNAPAPSASPGAPFPAVPAPAPASAPVPVALAVMSRCPDAHFCEAEFDHVLPLLHPGHAALELTYIGTPDPSAPYGVQCMHGDLECRGNIHQLCAAKALGAPHLGIDLANRALLDFVLCSNSNKDQIGQDSAAQQCWDSTQSQSSSLPGWHEVEMCIRDPAQGKALLLQSVKNTARRDVHSSCTVLIDHITPSCVRDGGVWRECPPGGGTEPVDFARQIESAWQHQQPSPVAASPGILPRRDILPLTQAFKRQADPSQSPVAPVGSTTATPPNSSDNSDGGDRKGLGTNPSIFTFVIAIALFAIVVGFITLRMIYQRRRGRPFFGRRAQASGPGNEETTLSRAATGTQDTSRAAENTPRSAIVTVDDPLKPPKLWDAKVADYDTLATLGYTYPASSGPEAQGAGTNAWDRIMPVAAALSPQLYPILFSDQDDKDKVDARSSSTQGASEVRRRMKSMRSQGRNNHPTSPVINEAHDADDDLGDEPTPANVNVTVLIAMPNASTVVPSNQNTKLGSKTAPASRVQTLQAEAGVVPDGADSKLARHASVRSARSVRSFRSTRTSASARSVASARRSAFFGLDYDPNLDSAADKDDKTKHKMRVDLVDTEPSGRLSDAGSFSEDAKGNDSDDSDDDEDIEVDGALPELMFGTASVPVYTLHSASNPKAKPSRTGSGLYTGGFTYSSPAPPTRNDLHALLARARDIRNNKPVPPLNITAAPNDTAPSQAGQHLSPLHPNTPPHRNLTPVASQSPGSGSLHSRPHPLAASPPPMTASPPPVGYTPSPLAMPLQNPVGPARSTGANRTRSGTESPAPMHNLSIPALSSSPVSNPWILSSPASPNKRTSLPGGNTVPSASGAPISDLRVVEEEETLAPTTTGQFTTPPLARPAPTPAQLKPDAELDELVNHGTT